MHFGYERCFNDARAFCHRLRGEIVGRGGQVSSRHTLGNLSHLLRGQIAFQRHTSRATFEVLDLLDDVLRRQPGKRGVLRSPLPTGHMAKAASEYIRRMPMCNDIRHRLVGRGMPIRYGKEVQELRLGKRRLTVGEVDQFDIVRRRGIPDSRRVERKQPLRYAKPAQLSRRDSRYQTEGQ